MQRLALEQKISSQFEAEQHVYSIPEAGAMASRAWTSLTHEKRVSLRNQALTIWKRFFENDGRTIPHPPIFVPEYRQMLSQPDGEMIVEEI